MTPFDIVGDFVYNFNEFGQIVITNFADVLNAGKSVEEAMEVAQQQAEDLAERVSERLTRAAGGRGAGYQRAIHTFPAPRRSLFRRGASPSRK